MSDEHGNTHECCERARACALKAPGSTEPCGNPPTICKKHYDLLLLLGERAVSQRGELLEALRGMATETPNGELHFGKCGLNSAAPSMCTTPGKCAKARAAIKKADGRE